MNGVRSIDRHGCSRSLIFSSFIAGTLRRLACIPTAGFFCAVVTRCSLNKICLRLLLVFTLAASGFMICGLFRVCYRALHSDEGLHLVGSANPKLDPRHVRLCSRVGRDHFFVSGFKLLR